MLEALHYFERAVELLPENQSYHIALSRAYSLANSPKKAIVAFVPVLAAAPDNPEFLYRMAWLLLELDEPVGAPRNVRALELIEKAYAADVERVDFRLTRIDAMIKNGENTEAMDLAVAELKEARDRDDAPAVAGLKQLIRELLDQ